MPYTDDMTISELLGTLMEDRDVSQGDLATSLQVSQSQVSRWLAGKDTPTAARVPILAEVLGLSEDRVVVALHEQRVRRRRSNDLEQRMADLNHEMAALRIELDALRKRMEAEDRRPHLRVAADVGIPPDEPPEVVTRPHPDPEPEGP